MAFGNCEYVVDLYVALVPKYLFKVVVRLSRSFTAGQNGGEGPGIAVSIAHCAARWTLRYVGRGGRVSLSNSKV